MRHKFKCSRQAVALSRHICRPGTGSDHTAGHQFRQPCRFLRVGATGKDRLRRHGETHHRECSHLRSGCFGQQGEFNLTQSRPAIDFRNSDTGKAEFLGELGALYEGFVRAFGEGPATGFRARRVAGVVEALKGREGAVVADLLDFLLLLEAFPQEGPPPHRPTEAERVRALLDRAWLLKEEDDWGALVEQLFAIGSPEALYLAAQVYLASGQWEDALALMEEVFRMDFQHPGYLPGYVLARMGQLLDLAGERERALRAYRGVLALSWAPEEARAVALAGLKTPFRL